MQGFVLHVLRHKKLFGYLKMAGLRTKLASIRPDIVQATHVIGWTPLQAAFGKPFFGYKLFTAAHYHASVFPLAHKKLSPWSRERLRCGITRTVPGWLVSQATEKCYAITSDCADVAARFFGVSKAKIEICPLGVDTELFHAISNEAEGRARVQLRQRQGFSESEWSAFTRGALARRRTRCCWQRQLQNWSDWGNRSAACSWAMGRKPKRSSPARDARLTLSCRFTSLGNFYRASNIGVWPTQESLSMLDASTCGLPIVANQSMAAPERLQGSGLTYRLNGLGDLVRVLLS